MIYPDTNFEDWVNRYSIKPKEHVCGGCNKKFITNVPIAIQGYRGLQTRQHECGKEFVTAVFKPVDKAEINFWLDVRFGT